MPTLAEHLTELIVRRGERSEIHAVTSELLAGLVKNRAPASAVWHPLGFVYLPLHRESKRTLRLHIWASELPRATLTTSPYHCHAWDLTSYVYCGRLSNVLVDVRPASAAPDYRIFHISGDSRIDLLQPTADVVSATIVSADDVVSGQTYTIPAGRYHATNVGDCLTATVVVAQRRPSFPEFTLGPVALGAHRTHRQPVSADLLTRTAARVLAASTA